MSTGKEVVAAGFIIFRRIQNEISYLLMHASYENNLWTPPKGHVDPGETEIQAAERETEEEAGLSREHYNTVEGFHKTLRYPVRNKLKRVEYWLAELRDPNTPVKLSDEHREYRWCNFDDTLKYARFPDMQDVYKEAHEFLQNQNT